MNMVCSKAPEDFRACVNHFAKAAGRSVDEGTDVFCQYVHKIGGSFHLAVLNVGAALCNRVVGHEGLMTPDERKQYPGVFESIGAARVKMNVTERHI